MYISDVSEDLVYLLAFGVCHISTVSPEEDTLLRHSIKHDRSKWKTWIHIWKVKLCTSHGSMYCSFVASSGSSDVGSGSSHVHPVRHWRVPGAHHLHEEFGCQPARQEEQEAAGLYLPNQKWGRKSERLVQSAVVAVKAVIYGLLTLYVHGLTLSIIGLKLIRPHRTARGMMYIVQYLRMVSETTNIFSASFVLVLSTLVEISSSILVFQFHATF